MSFCNKTALDYFEAAKKHKDSNRIFIEKAFKLWQSKPYEITTGCSDLGKLVKKRGNAVIWESYKLSAYVRLTPLKEMILFGSCNPEHDTGELIAKYISERFQKFLIIIFTDDKHHLATKRFDVKQLPHFTGSNKEEIVNKMKHFAESVFDERLDEKYLLSNTDDLWEVFYESQYLSQRQNLKLYHRDVPKYMFKKARMEIEEKFYKKATDKNEQNETLDKYLNLKG